MSKRNLLLKKVRVASVPILFIWIGVAIVIYYASGLEIATKDLRSTYGTVVNAICVNTKARDGIRIHLASEGTLGSEDYFMLPPGQPCDKSLLDRIIQKNVVILSHNKIHMGIHVGYDVVVDERRGILAIKKSDGIVRFYIISLGVILSFLSIALVSKKFKKFGA